ncbi:MAG TPA: PfkB family carbohydrate kinase [Actinomycetales bacterium]|nr:PfkB family carbohydrate kinase [Actinomycetales bacterium]
MRLTDREQQILQLLRRDPTLPSDAIALALGTTRASVNVHLSNLVKKGAVRGRGYILNESPSVVVLGGSNLDIKARSTERLQPGTSNPGTGSMSAGGVGRNIAENLARLGTRTVLVSSVGRDAAGETVLAQSAAAGVVLDHVHRTDGATGTYVALLDDDGELVAAVSDMAAADELGPDQVDAVRDVIASAALVVVDGNLPPAAVDVALERAHLAGVRVIVEPVSGPKAARLVPQLTPKRPLYGITPNRDELAALTGLPTRTQRQVERAVAALHAQGVGLVWVRLAERGSMLSERHPDGTTTRHDLDALPTTVRDVTGAGDSMLAAFCHALLEGNDPAQAARYGHAAAALTIASSQTVRSDLTARLLESTLLENA